MASSGSPLTLEDIYRKLELRIDLAGSLRKAALEMGMSPAAISLVLQGKRNPGPRLLAQLGLRRIIRRSVTYVEQ